MLGDYSLYLFIDLFIFGMI